MASKKKLGLVAVVGAAALFASAAVPAASQAASEKTIAFVMGAINDPFFNAMKAGAVAEAKAKGVKLIWQGDVQYSAATQLPVVDQVIAQKPDGLVLIPTDPVALQPSVAKAKAAGITVVNVDTHVNDLTDVVSFITGDNADGGAKAADALANAMRYQAGKKYQVVVGLTSATATTNVARLDGFTKAVAAKYPGIQIVDKAYSQSDSAIANTNVNNWLTKYPKLRGIFAIDGTNATGAAAAIQSKGLIGKIALVGYDAYPANVKLIQKKVFSALIAQDPAAEAKKAIDTLIDFWAGKTSTIVKNVVIPNVVLSGATSKADLKKYTYVA